MTDQLSINNFFSFLAAMMLAYQPVKSLANVNVSFGQGLSAGKRILPIIDQSNTILINESGNLLKIKDIHGIVACSYLRRKKLLMN